MYRDSRSRSPTILSPSASLRMNSAKNLVFIRQRFARSPVGVPVLVDQPASQSPALEVDLRIVNDAHDVSESARRVLEIDFLDRGRPLECMVMRVGHLTSLDEGVEGLQDEVLGRQVESLR